MGKAKSSGVIGKMKENIKNAGSNRKEVLWVQADTKRRVRFLSELDEANEYKVHNSYERRIQAVCLEHLGKDCPYCAETDETIKDQTFYAISVFDYDTNSVRILFEKATGVTPIPSFIEYFEEYGTLKDRDYTIKKNGKGQGSSYTVMPGEVSKFRNQKAKPFSEKQMLKILSDAYKPNPDDLEDEDDDEPKKGKKSSSKKEKSGKKKKELSLRDKMAKLEIDDIKNIAIEAGMSKKEMKGLDDEEILDLLFEDYEEEDIEEVYEDFMSDDEDDDEEEDDE